MIPGSCCEDIAGRHIHACVVALTMLTFDSASRWTICEQVEPSSLWFFHVWFEWQIIGASLAKAFADNKERLCWLWRLDRCFSLYIYFLTEAFNFYLFFFNSPVLPFRNLIKSAHYHDGDPWWIGWRSLQFFRQKLQTNSIFRIPTRNPDVVER